MLKDLLQNILQQLKTMLRKVLIWLGLGILMLIGFWVYNWYYKKTANWQPATLYFSQFSEKEPFTGYFVVENDSLKKDEICVQSVYRKSSNSKLRHQHCVRYEYVYKERNGESFKAKEVTHYEIHSKK